ncbi:MAG: hypothetical protein JWM31_2115, partial [Solirubrobacterales bacterium]|nr:hypothetical protein [Solirubrobacterales bacterium]
MRCAAGGTPGRRTAGGDAPRAV